MLFPMSTGFSQKTDTPPTLSVTLTSESPYVYQDQEGYTIVVGSVQNTDSLSAVTNVIIRAEFYDDFSFNPLEIAQGETSLKVIPKGGISPYVIKSNTPNPEITQASVFLESFDISPSKSKLLTLELSDIYVDENLVFSGNLQNGPAPVADVNIHVAFYDAFVPPRILDVSTIAIGSLNPNQITSFNFDDMIDKRSVGFSLFAESDVFYSEFLDVKIPEPIILTKRITISDVNVTDLMGNSISEIKMGSVVKIKSNSWIEISPDHTSEIPYRYYVQVKESGEKPYVEYIGKYDGRYLGEGSQSQTIDWIPEKKGLFFIETYVWDRSNLPISDPGPISIILVS